MLSYYKKKVFVKILSFFGKCGKKKKKKDMIMLFCGGKLVKLTLENSVNSIHRIQLCLKWTLERLEKEILVTEKNMMDLLSVWIYFVNVQEWTEKTKTKIEFCFK